MLRRVRAVGWGEWIVTVFVFFICGHGYCQAVCGHSQLVLLVVQDHHRLPIAPHSSPCIFPDDTELSALFP